MGYIDKVLGIKSSASLAKYLKEQTGADIEVVKVANSLRVFWAADNTLHKFDIKAHVIYTVQEEEINDAITVIKKTVSW